MDKFEYHKENIKEFARNTMFYYYKVHQLLSDELDREEISEHALYGYHSMAYSNYLTMKSYYLQNDVLAHEEFDHFFEKAAQFSREFTSSREINHSMQWTFGYYVELVEAYNFLAELLGVNKYEVPE